MENKYNPKKILESKIKIEELKNKIHNLTLDTQEIILKSCATADLELIKNNQDVKEFKNKLYKFQKYLIITEGYNFYNEFYIQMMEALDKKRELIEKYGVLEAYNLIPEHLSLLETRQKKLNIFSIAKRKLFELFKINQNAYKQEKNN